MAELLSLYRKDYRWPRLKPPFERRDLRCKLAVPMTEEQAKALELKCGPQRYGDVNEDAPKLGKIGPCPKTDRLDYSEEDACLKKLLEDNPNLMSVLKKKPVTDAIGQFNKERLTSTYRADYDHTKNEPAPAEWRPEVCPLDDPLAAEPGTECKSKHVSRKQLLRMVYGPGYCAPGPPCTRTRTAPDPEQQKQQARKRPQFDDTCQPQYKRKCVPKWTSEYREAIGATGLDIMRETRVRAYRRCRTMRRKADRRDCEANVQLMFG